MYRPLWIEINLGNLGKNLDLMKKRVGSRVKIMATVKQNAYGHGLVAVARYLSGKGIDFFGVNSVEEALTLRESGIKTPVLVLSPVFADSAETVIKHDITSTVVSLPFARELNKRAGGQGKIVPVHVKIDTGMGRLGPWHETAGDFICRLKRFKNLSLEGVYTHFPVADTDPVFSRKQVERFNRLLACCAGKKITFKYAHCANSAGLLKYKHSHFNLVRPGLALYGVNPGCNSDSGSLAPVLSFKSRIIYLKKSGAGISIGYGRTYSLKKEALIATVAVGYADGYPWSLANRAKVIVEGKLCPVRGRVCMDHVMVEVPSGSGAKVGSEVILIGRKKDVVIKTETLAKWAGTIPYEVLARLSSKIPRIYKRVNSA